MDSFCIKCESYYAHLGYLICLLKRLSGTPFSFDTAFVASHRISHQSLHVNAVLNLVVLSTVSLQRSSAEIAFHIQVLDAH